MRAMAESDGCRAGEPAIRLGVSACLLGEQVRFDGGHKRDPFLTQTLGRYVQWLPVCPEVELGLGVPREALRLVGSPNTPRLVASRSGRDYTEAMEAWAERRLDELAGAGLHGFILKKASPSCGLERVRVYGPSGMPQSMGRGIFARALVLRLPCLPVQEEGRLHDMALRENLIERLFAYCRWSRMLAADPTPAGLAAFHAAHRLALLAHSPRRLRALGRLAALAPALPWTPLVEEYGCLLTETLAVLATPDKHARVLRHLLRHLDLDGSDRAELAGLIEEYRQGLVPLVVPLTLFQHHLRRQAVPAWLQRQAYLSPYPKELLLRNHV